MNNNSFSSRILDVGNEKLNFIGPIDNLFNQHLLSFDDSLERVHSSDSSLCKHVAFSKLYAEDRIQDEEQGLSESEIAAINLYTREWGDLSVYYRLNASLRREDRTELIPWFPYLRLLISGLLKLENYKGDLWRGIKNVDLNPKYKRGNKIFWWGISSCTTEMEVLNTPNFLGDTGKRVLFKIKCTKGVDIQKYSSIPNEAEVLLLPGSYLEVMGVLPAGNNLTIVDLKQIEPPVPIFEFPNSNPPQLKTSIRPTTLTPTPTIPVQSPARTPTISLVNNPTQVTHIPVSITPTQTTPVQSPARTPTVAPVNNPTTIFLERDLKFTISSGLSSSCFDNHTATARYSWSAFETNKVFSTGKHYWEVIPKFQPIDQCFIFVGVCFPGTAIKSSILGSDNCWSFSPYYQDLRYNNSTLATQVGRKIKSGERLGLFLDCNNHTLQFFIEGEKVEQGFNQVIGSVTPVVSIAYATVSVNQTVELPQQLLPLQKKKTKKTKKPKKPKRKKIDQWVCEICDKPEDQCCCDDYLPEKIETYYPPPPTTRQPICSYFLEGNCRYGVACRDYHPTYPHFQQQEVSQYFLHGNL